MALRMGRGCTQRTRLETVQPRLRAVADCTELNHDGLSTLVPFHKSCQQA